jgi:hypothetical protein
MKLGKSLVSELYYLWNHVLQFDAGPHLAGGQASIYKVLIPEEHSCGGKVTVPRSLKVFGIFKAIWRDSTLVRTYRYVRRVEIIVSRLF